MAFSVQDRSYFFDDYTVYAEILSIENDPYVPYFKYRYISDIKKAFKVTTLLKRPHEGISERNFEILEEMIKKHYYCNPYESMTSLYV